MSIISTLRLIYQNLSQQFYKIIYLYPLLSWKRSVFIPIPKKGNAKECSNYNTITLISHTSKVMLKILQARFQQYVNRELPSSWIQKRQRNQRSTCQHPLDHRKSKRVPEKHLLLFYWLCAFDYVDHNELWIILQDGNTRPPDLPPEISVWKSRSNSQNCTWNHRLVPNQERNTSRLYIVTLLI